MRTIVVGAGEVGSYVAEKLSQEGQDVVLIEQDPGRVGELDGQFDAMVVRGSGTDPATLKRLGAARADLIVAVTSDDETNVVCAMLAKAIGATNSIVRIEARSLREAVGGEMADRTGVDLVIDPDEETAAEILELVEYPGAVEVELLEEGRILVLGVRLAADAPVVGETLHDLAVTYAPKWEFLFGAITRGAQTVIPRGDHQLQAGDLVRVICTPEGRKPLLGLLGVGRAIPRRVVLLGGGRTAELVAERLRKRVRQVTIVESDEQRATELAERLNGVDIAHGDITDTDLLRDIDIGLCDLVVALTGDDDANILACLFAKSAGVVEAIAVAHRLSLLPLLTEIGVDGALSPRTATANAVLRHARGGGVMAVATFLSGDVEVLELEVHDGSPAADTILSDLHLPKDVLVGAVMSADGTEIGRGSTRLHAGDRIVLFAKPAAMPAAKKAFG